jgi:aryl-alcohol dehydrogenase-like predicted oxidoreductase
MTTDRSELGRRGFLGLALGAAAAACGKTAPPPPPDVTSETQLTSGAPLARRRLGRTNVMVSMIGIGGAHLGRTKDENEAIRIVHAALDHGVTFLDNCWDYNGGVSEERMGKALTGGYRQRAFLMTKLDGRTRDAANAQLEQSLRRLGTDVIDLVQVHEVIRPTDPGRVFAEGGAMEALIAARQAGKIRFLGFTGFRPLTDEERTALLQKTAKYAKDGKSEPFKTSTVFDGTTKNPKWLESADI